MAGLFGTLDIAARALQINQRGLGVTSHNIANVNTPGYTRQRQELVNAIPIPHPAGTIGMGVSQRTIERVHDEFLQARLIQEHVSYGSLQAESGALGQLDALYNEASGDGITPQLSALYNTFGELASSGEPFQPTIRASLLGVAETVTTTFHRFDRQMSDLQRSTDRAIVGLIPEINGMLERISALNQEIVKNETVAPANDLRDEQERLIRGLADKIGITTLTDSQGMAVVLFEGGIPLVEGLQSNELVAVPDPTNPFDPTFTSVYLSVGNNSFDVTSRVQGGELGGLLRARDVHIADAIRDLDALAYSLVQSVNDQHNLGRGVIDDTANDFFALTTGGTVAGSAGEISLAAAIDPAAGGDLLNIAAGAPPGPAGATNNENALELEKLKGTSLPSYAPGDLLGAPSGVSQTVIQQSAGMIATRGRAAQLVDFSLVQQEQVLGEIQNRRDAISAVSLDEEVTDLIRLQASYQANARVITTVNEMLGELTRLI